MNDGCPKHQTTCQCCASDKIVRYGEQHWEVWGTTYHLAKCEECGLVFTDPIPTDATVARVYAEMFSYTWYSDHYWLKLIDARQRLTEYGAFLGRRVLDYGGGLGYFASACVEKGHVSEVFDPFANREAGNDHKWDAVVGLHVLEHSNNLTRTVLDMKSRLQNPGTLIIAVPNGNGFGYRRHGMNWVWAQPPLVHIFHFSERSLVTLLERHGLAVTRVSYADRWDANSVADVHFAAVMRKLDAKWEGGKRPLFRKAVSLRNGLIRNITLHLSRFANSAKVHTELAELTIVAQTHT